MEAIKYLEAYDAILDILGTIGYNNKSQPDKASIINALTSVKDITDEFLEKDRITVEAKKFLYTINGVTMMPEGAVSNEVKTIIIDSICVIQHEIVKCFFEEYYNKNIDDILDYENILRQMVNNYYGLE